MYEHLFDEWFDAGYYYLQYKMIHHGAIVKQFTDRMPVEKRFGEHTAFDWENVSYWEEEEPKEAKELLALGA